MSNVKVKLNRSEVKKLLKSQEIMNICTQHAFAAKNRLGEGYEVTYRTGKNRVNASIMAVTATAQHDNLKNNTILKALK